MSRSLDVARALFRDIPLYVPDTRKGIRLDVSDNTNLFGSPPAAGAAVRGAPSELLARYPIPYGVDLKTALARHLGVAPECVTTGCGSDDLLDCAIRAFGEPGDVLAHALPTFSMIPIFAQLNGLQPRGVRLQPDWDVNMEGLLASEPKLLYLCSPNNPTGTLVSRPALERLLAQAPGVVLLDEAYAEFSGISDLARAPTHGRLLVTRTFSKAFGLAGLRIGYAVGSPQLIREVEKSRGPYTLSALAERAALAALAGDLPWVEAQVQEARHARERLAAALKDQGLPPVPSAANFVLVPLPGAPEVARRMREEAGIVVRAFAELPGVGDALRIGVGPWPLMEEVLASLKRARS
jgi:histidinol-phosphate aminotransferase